MGKHELTDQELQERAEAEAARFQDEKRAAKVRARTPAVPPGVKMFDPRRLRRHERTTTLHSANRNLAKMLGESEAKAKRVAALVADQRMKEARAASMGRAAGFVGVVGRVRSLVGGLLGRRGQRGGVKGA
jgi:hypothetical protein